MSRIEEPTSREGLELLELTRPGLDAAMPAGRGAGAGDHGKRGREGEQQQRACRSFSGHPLLVYSEACITCTW